MQAIFSPPTHHLPPSQPSSLLPTPPPLQLRSHGPGGPYLLYTTRQHTLHTASLASLASAQFRPQQMQQNQQQNQQQAHELGMQAAMRAAMRPAAAAAAGAWAGTGSSPPDATVRSIEHHGLLVAVPPGVWRGLAAVNNVPSLRGCRAVEGARLCLNSSTLPPCHCYCRRRRRLPGGAADAPRQPGGGAPPRPGAARPGSGAGCGGLRGYGEGWAGWWGSALAWHPCLPGMPASL